MGLQENLQAEQVCSLPLRDPVIVSPHTSIAEVVEAMKTQRLGCAIVVDADSKPIGIFTESQLVRLLAESQSNFGSPVSQVMSHNWPTVKQNAPIVDVLKLMRKHNVRFIIVINEEGQLAGLTGQRSMLEYIADHFPEQVMVQRIGGTPHLHNREGA
jgi:CBS domain-containing protein